MPQLCLESLSSQLIHTSMTPIIQPPIIQIFYQFLFSIKGALKHSLLKEIDDREDYWRLYGLYIFLRVLCVKLNQNEEN